MDGDDFARYFEGMASSDLILQGKLILDSGKLQGSFFDRTVVLVCRHDSSGAFGLVLNRRTQHLLGSAARGELDPRLAQSPLFAGGPVQTEVFSFLLETEMRPEFDILPNVAMGHSLDDLKQRFDTMDDSLRIRAFAGYAGWSPGQLEEEQKRGCWINHPATADLIFHPEPQNLWIQILKLKGGPFSLMADFPDDPSKN